MTILYVDGRTGKTEQLFNVNRIKIGRNNTACLYFRPFDITDRKQEPDQIIEYSYIDIT